MTDPQRTALRGGARGTFPAAPPRAFVYVASPAGNLCQGVARVGEELEKRLEALLGTLERMRLDEYVEHISNRKRLIWDNLLYGMVRGFGFTLGFAVLAALCAVVLKNMVVENIPVIGGFLAEVINAIEARM